VEALGYWVSVEPFQGQRDIINGGFTSQRVGAHVLIIYPPPLDPQWNKEEIAMKRLQQVHIDSVDVEVTEDLLSIDPLAAPHTPRRHTRVALRFLGEEGYLFDSKYNYDLMRDSYNRCHCTPPM